MVECITPLPFNPPLNRADAPQQSTRSVRLALSDTLPLSLDQCINGLKTDRWIRGWDLDINQCRHVCGQRPGRDPVGSWLTPTRSTCSASGSNCSPGSGRLLPLPRQASSTTGLSRQSEGGHLPSRQVATKPSPRRSATLRARLPLLRAEHNVPACLRSPTWRRLRSPHGAYRIQAEPISEGIQTPRAQHGRHAHVTLVEGFRMWRSDKKGETLATYQAPDTAVQGIG